jgi:hypothetical protein
MEAEKYQNFEFEAVRKIAFTESITKNIPVNR